MSMKYLSVLAVLASLVCTPTAAQVTKAADKASAPVSADAKKDIQRHRAIAVAHESAAKCLESGQPEETCHKALQAACKGLAIGKHCGMRHEH
jgi:hypothetical protein